MNRIAVLALLGTIILSGCSFTGLNNSSDTFACKAPPGVSCTSVSGVYANAMQNNLPALRDENYKAVDATLRTVSASTMQLPVAMPGMPIRSQPKTLRIWMAPWGDEEGALHDQTYMFVVTDNGKWLVEQSRQATVAKSMTRLQRLGTAAPDVAAAETREKPYNVSKDEGVLQTVNLPPEMSEK